MKGKLLLAVGVILVLFGVLGAVAVGFAYYYTTPLFGELTNTVHKTFSRIEQTFPLIDQTFSTVDKTLTDTTKAIKDASQSLNTAADQIDISLLGWRPFGKTADSLRKTASSIYEMSYDSEALKLTAQTGRGQILSYRELILNYKEIILNQINTMKLVFTIMLAWIGILHSLIALIGICLLHIRKPLKRKTLFTALLKIKKRIKKTKTISFIPKRLYLVKHVRKGTITFGAVIFALGLIVIVLSTIMVPYTTTKSVKVEKSATWLSETFLVPAGTHKAYFEDLQADEVLRITFTVTQGGNRDVDFYLMDETNYYKWKAGEKPAVEISRSRATSLDQKWTAPRTAKWFLVFDNSFSLITGKTVANKVDRFWYETEQRQVTENRLLLPSEGAYFGVAALAISVIVIGYGAVSKPKLSTIPAPKSS